MRDSADQPLLHFDEPLSLDRIFAPREIGLAQELREIAEGGGAAGSTHPAGPSREDLARVLDRGFRYLGALALSLEYMPSLRSRELLGDRERSEETLLKSLAAVGSHGIEWSLPTKAVVSRAFGIAKVNFWTSVRYALDQEGFDDASMAPIIERVSAAIEEAVYTRLAEELYGSFASSMDMDPVIKRSAIEHGIDLWEGRVRLATDRFCPILRSAWAARMRAPRAFGTLLGTSEIVQLLFRDCDERFVEVFHESHAGPARVQAFEEFLFDLPYESLQRVRSKMEADGKSCVGPDEVAGYLGFKELRPLLTGPRSLYSSFRRRRVKAQYRTSVAAPGPHRTAESYVLEALLRQELEVQEATSSSSEES